MGYVSGHFRTEKQNPTLKVSLTWPMVKPWDSSFDQKRNASDKSEASVQRCYLWRGMF